MNSVKSQSVDATVSNELICDLHNRAGLVRAFREFHRVLKPGGTMIHGEWSSSPDNNSRELTVSHSPAWNPDQLSILLDQTGFHKITVCYFETTVKFSRTAALAELRTWGAGAKLLEDQLSRSNRSMSLPFEHIIISEKR